MTEKLRESKTESDLSYSQFQSPTINQTKEFRKFI